MLVVLVWRHTLPAYRTQALVTLNTAPKHVLKANRIIKLKANLALPRSIACIPKGQTAKPGILNEQSQTKNQGNPVVKSIPFKTHRGK